MRKGVLGLCFVALLVQLFGVAFAYVGLASDTSDVQLVNEASHGSIDVFVDGSFKYDPDDKWRCTVNVTIVNEMSVPVVIQWICLTLLDVTYVDYTFEELNTPINNTVDIVISSQSSHSFNWNVTESGFYMEPKLLRVECTVHTNTGDWFSMATIPEFPSLLILPLFMIAALLVVMVCKRKLKTRPRTQ